MVKQYILLLFFVSCHLSVWSQGGLVSFSGKVVDAVDSSSVREAYVAIPSIGYGTAVNDEGDFRFFFPRISSDSMVVVTAMGYQPLTYTAADLLSAGVVTLELMPVPAATLPPDIADARVFVEEALAKIPANYATEPIFQNGFYNETVRFREEGVVRISEALLRVERFPSPEYPQDKLKYLKGRRFERRDQTAKMGGFGLKNGAAIVTRSVETSVPIYLTPDEIKNYAFTLDSVQVAFDDYMLYRIFFTPIGKKVKAARTGTLYVEPISKAIVRMEYEMTPEAAREVMNSGISSIEMEGKAVRSYAQYRQFGDKWMLQDASLTFEASFANKLQKRDRVDAEMTIRFIANISQPLIRSSIPDDRQLTATNEFPLVWQYDDTFWDGQNFLLPTDTERKIKFEVN